MGKEEKLDCLLVYVPKLNNFYKPIGSYIFPMQLPMGLLAIADLIHKDGFNIEIIHLGIEKIKNPGFSFVDYLEKRKPKIIGLSLHWYYQAYDVINLAKKIKLAVPDSIVVLGGITASYFSEEIMKDFDCIDIIVRGEGEKPFLDLTKAIFNCQRDFSAVPNLIWRDKDELRINPMAYVAKKEDLDELNFDNFSLLRNFPLYIRLVRNPWLWLKGLNGAINLKFIQNNCHLFPLAIYRGCSTDCSYCGGGRFAQEKINNRKKISIRSIDKVIESIKSAQRYNYDTLYINYLPFKEDPDYFEKLFKEIKEEHISINCLLDCFVLPSEDLIRLFKTTFLSTPKTQIHISAESGSEAIRMRNKGYFFNNQELFDRLKVASDLRLKVNLFFSLGLPFEKAEDIKMSRAFQATLKNTFGSNIVINTETLSLIPGSPMEINAKGYGIIKTKNSFMDFFKSSGLNSSTFFPSDLGYFKEDYCSANEQSFREELGKIRCKDFCRLSSLIGSSRSSYSKTIYCFSRFLCNISYICRKIVGYN